MHKFQKERRINPLGFFECGDTTHFMADCPKRKSTTTPTRMTTTTRTTTRRRITLGTRR
jgi:hypothetical protein